MKVAWSDHDCVELVKVFETHELEVLLAMAEEDSARRDGMYWALSLARVAAHADSGTERDFTSGYLAQLPVAVQNHW